MGWQAWTSLIKSRACNVGYVEKAGGFLSITIFILVSASYVYGTKPEALESELI